MRDLLQALAGWCAAIVISLAGFGASSVCARDFRAADNQAPDYPTVLALDYMSRLVFERTQGRHRVTVFHSRQLGEEKETIEQARAGAIDINRINAAPLSAGRPGVLHGARSYLMQDDNGQIIETHSVSAGLDYPGVGPEHSYLKDIGRAEYVAVTDAEALTAFHDLCRYEGIIPALESSHALAYAAKLAPTLGKDQVILVNLSGRGDKDINTVAGLAGITL